MRKHAVLQESNKASGSEVPPALELKSITAGYGKSVVLHDVDITVSAGSVVALIGSNGAGKTTLLRTAAGLLRPRSGRVHMSGDDCTERKPWERSRGGLCLVPEGRGVFRRLTVSDNLRLQVSPSSKDSSVERALDAFPALRFRLHVPAGKLSGGEQQMLALARAYLSNPSVLLLDEVSDGSRSPHGGFDLRIPCRPRQPRYCTAPRGAIREAGPGNGGLRLPHQPGDHHLCRPSL